MSNNIYDILKKFNNLDSVKNILSEGKKVKEGTGKCNESDKGKMCPVHGMKECSGMYEGLDMETAGPDEDLARKIAAIARSLKPRRIFEPIAEYFDDSLDDGLSAWNDMGYNDWTMDLAGTVSERLGVDLFELWKEMKSGNNGLDEGAKPDFLDMDKDGDTKEPMKKAAKEKSKGAMAEAIARVEQQLNEKYQGFKEDTRLAMRRGPGADMMRYDKDSPAPGAKQHRDATAKAAKAFRSAGGKMSNDVEVGRNASLAQPSRNDKGNAALGDKQLVRYSKTNEGEANEDMLSPGQKKIAKMSPPPDKIDANDLKALRAGKDKKKEGAGVMHFKKQQAKADGKDSFKLGDKEYPVQEGFPTTADSKKRMDDREGKTAHGKKTATKTGMKHERDYDREETGERGRPVKDKFAKKK